MKKTITLLLVAVLTISMAVPAYAYGGDAPAASWSSWWSNWSDFFFGGREIVQTKIGIPEISEARYCHKGAYTSLANRLQVKWSEVEDADAYEVEIRKADNTIETYTVTSNSLFLKNTSCPRVYIEKDNTWAAATVRVRAIVGDATGDWSESVKIGCDAIH